MAHRRLQRLVSSTATLAVRISRTGLTTASLARRKRDRRTPVHPGGVSGHAATEPPAGPSPLNQSSPPSEPVEGPPPPAEDAGPGEGPGSPGRSLGSAASGRSARDDIKGDGAAPLGMTGGWEGDCPLLRALCVLCERCSWLDGGGRRGLSQRSPRSQRGEGNGHVPCSSGGGLTDLTVAPLARCARWVGMTGLGSVPCRVQGQVGVRVRVRVCDGVRDRVRARVRDGTFPPSPHPEQTAGDTPIPFPLSFPPLRSRRSMREASSPAPARPGMTLAEHAKGAKKRTVFFSPFLGVSSSVNVALLARGSLFLPFARCARSDGMAGWGMSGLAPEG